MVRSRFSIYTWFLFFFTTAFVAVGVFLLAHPNFGTNGRIARIKPVALPGVIVFFIAVGFGYFFAGRLFILTIYPDELVLFTRFSRYTLQKAEISRIRVMGRGSVLGNRGDTLVIETIAEQSFSLPDQFCRNMPECKMALLENYREFVVDAPSPRPPMRLPAGDGEEEFYGNHVLSMNGIFLYGLAAVFTWQGITLSQKPGKVTPLIVVIPILGFAFLFAWQLFYFRIDGDVFEIRNHIFRWYRKQYPLQDIALAVITRVGRQSNSLRIRTADLRSGSFAAGSLRDRHWVALATALKERGVPVKDELFLVGLPLTRDEQV